MCTQEFLAEEGTTREDGTREDPSLPAFEAEVARYRAIQVWFDNIMDGHRS